MNDVIDFQGARARRREPCCEDVDQRSEVERGCGCECKCDLDAHRFVGRCAACGVRAYACEVVRARSGVLMHHCRTPHA